jgi:hypothetical protein|tara:strand:- start:981 stop:1553 length:573 start_codon:yes stop_codon:yes gene_type:complete
MSFVRFKKQDQLEQPKETAAEPAKLHIRIDAAPIPLGASKDISSEKREAQTQALEKVRKMGKDLFAENNTIVSNTAGERLYQTKELYSQRLSIEELIPLLTASDLTLRVNAVRGGVHAHSTCMELKSGILADLLSETSDSNREKSTKLELTNSSEKGEMYVSVREVKGKHYINKVDYKISSIEDDRLHVK